VRFLMMWVGASVVAAPLVAAFIRHRGRQQALEERLGAARAGEAEEASGAAGLADHQTV
jgi:hypothetical protein